VSRIRGKLPGVRNEIVERQPQYRLGGVTEQVLASDVRFQYAFAVYVEEDDALGGLLDHRPETTLALTELFFRLLTFGEVDHRDHLGLAPVVGDDRGLSSVGKMMPSFRSPCFVRL
jgi:hypothetical protein